MDVQPTGSRVVLRGKAIELGVSYALEGGASGVVIPWPGPDSFKTIMKMADDLPVWLAPDGCDPDHPDVRAALDLGAVGVWLDERLFAAPDPAGTAQQFRALVHAPVAESA